MAARRQHLVQRRKTLGLSQEALAARLQVERSTVARWETGGTRPQLWMRPRLAEVLQVSPDQLNDLLSVSGEVNAERDQDGRPAMSTDAGPGGMGGALPVCQLPPAVADFTGRDREVAELADLLGRDRDDRVGVPVAVIAGLPGAGKTALALQVAHVIRATFPDGQLWVPLEGATGRPRDPGEVLGELIRALGVPGAAIPASTAERASLYRSRLAGRQVLVLADDAASAAQVRPLLPGTGRSAVLITSRNDLAGPPGSRLVPLSPLSPAEAVQLLAKIVGPRVAAEPAAAAELAAACGQLPLAVRIAGARLAARGSWQLSALARKITRARRRLDELQTGDMSVRASLSQSYDALDETGRRAFRRLALLDSAEFTEWQAAALLGVDDAAQVVGRLADSSLLTAAGLDAAGQARYRPHDLVRDYAAERLADELAGDRDAALSRVTHGWMQLAARADTGLPREPYFPEPDPPPSPGTVPESLGRDITAEPAAWFTAERLALLAVIDRCCATGQHAAAAQLACCLASYWHLQGRLDDAERSWQTITTAAERADDLAATARARLRLAAATCGQGRHAQASPLVDRCITAFAQLGDHRALAAAHYWRAVCRANLDDHAGARGSAQRAIELSEENRDRRAEALALRLLAIAQANLPEHRKHAVSSARQALKVAMQLGQPTSEQEIMHSVAHVYNLMGEYEEGLRVAQEGLARARGLSLQVAKGDWLGISADAYQGLGRYREAAQALLAALPIFRDHFMHRHHALCLIKLGYAYKSMGDGQAAARYLHQSIDMFSELELPRFQARAREALEACQTTQHAT
jgi:transcriptional regulator with XRE-family HTH domain/tetratricopeptide (TPR) repeat protein